MANPDTQKRLQRVEALLQEIKAGQERDKELRREFQRALEKLRRLAAA